MKRFSSVLVIVSVVGALGCAQEPEVYRDQGLTVVAPTQRYGYVAGGTPASADEEARYIEQVWETAYGVLADVPATLDESNHERYGVSSTPTIVLVDRDGVIRLYHPGRMTEEDLEPIVRQWVVGD